MELRYRFDPKRFRLGRLCKHGHCWPGTDQSLRRIHPIAPHCVGCTGAKQRDWLISFIDYEALELPDGQTLGKLCPKEHRWNGLGTSLRFNRRCLECERAKGHYLSEEQKLTLAQEYNKRARERRKRYKARVREQLRQKGLTARGTSVVSPGRQRSLLGSPEDRRLYKAIRNAGKLPTVAWLVAAEQRRYWAENPEAYKEYCRASNRDRTRWRQLTDPEYRLYNRQKSKRRKALLKNTIGLQLRGKQVRARFAQFDHQCAYCGASGDLHIEHVVPISKGGTHVLGNIVPACQRCNFRKATNDVETWYRSQPFFCEARWRKIRRVLSLGKGPVNQLALL